MVTLPNDFPPAARPCRKGPISERMDTKAVAAFIQKENLGPKAGSAGRLGAKNPKEAVLNCAGPRGKHPNMRASVLVFTGLPRELAVVTGA